MRINKIEEKNSHLSETGMHTLYGMPDMEQKPIVEVSFEFDNVKDAHKFYESMNQQLNNQKIKDKKDNLKSQIKELQKRLKEVK